MAEHQPRLDCAVPRVALELEGGIDRRPRHPRARPSHPNATARARAPPELTENRAWRPSPIGRTIGEACAGDQQPGRRIAHPARLAAPRAPRPGRGPARTRRRSRRRAPPARAAPASAPRRRAPRRQPESPSSCSRAQAQPGGGAVAAVALEVAGGGMQPAEQVEAGDAAPGSGAELVRPARSGSPAGGGARRSARRRSRSPPGASPRWPARRRCARRAAATCASASHRIRCSTARRSALTASSSTAISAPAPGRR